MNRTNDDLIKAFMSLHAVAKVKSFHNPIISLISPEWFYSESFKIINTDGIFYHKGISMIEKLSDDWNNYKLSDIIETHEKTFSSWYQPYHFFLTKKWGIHLRYDSLLNTSKYFLSMGSLNRTESINMAFCYYVDHTLFHLFVENLATTLEIILDNPYIYNDYYYNIYKKSFHSGNSFEEDLCNNYLLSNWKIYGYDISFLKHLQQSKSGQMDLIFPPAHTEIKKITRILLSQILSGKVEPNNLQPLEYLMSPESWKKYVDWNDIGVWIHFDPRFVN
jgi:hypothetical protein